MQNSHLSRGGTHNVYAKIMNDNVQRRINHGLDFMLTQPAIQEIQYSTYKCSAK